MNIYVGNISRDATEDDLRQAFEAFGRTASVTILKDKIRTPNWSTEKPDA